MPTSQVLVALFPVLFPADAPGHNAEDSSGTWVPVTHVGDKDDVPGSDSGLGQPHPAPAVAATWGVNKQMEDRAQSSTAFQIFFKNPFVSVT